MSSCVGCKRRTTSFCYQHKSAICDDCIAITNTPSLSINQSINCQANCVIGNYFDWLIDGQFEPIRCTCNRIITADQSTNQSIRLVCKHVFHRSCLIDALTKQLEEKTSSQSIDLSSTQSINQSINQLTCLTCQAVLYDSLTQAKSKLRESVYQFLIDSLGDKKSINQSISQSVNPSINQTPEKTPVSVNQSINQSTPSKDSLLLSSAVKEENKTPSSVNQPLNQSTSNVPKRVGVLSSKPSINQSINQSNKHSFDESVDDSNIEDERAPLINQSINDDQSINQSRQRFAGATVIDIDDNQSINQSINQSVKSKKSKLPHTKKQSIKNSRLIVRLIVCLMILCFLSSLGLYIAFSMNWITFPKSKGN